MKYSPIALFVYNRLQHTVQTVEFLKKNELASESSLYFFSDAPRRPNHNELVRAVRKYIHSVSGFKDITIIERDQHYGLANSIIAGVSMLCNNYGQVIVLEDDLITSKYFLQFMNQALDIYRFEDKVISINGYSYSIKYQLPNTYFSSSTNSWGWATWKRSWDLFEPDGSLLLNKIRKSNLERQFNHNGSYNFSRMLINQIKGNNDSWAIRWYASSFLNSKLSLYPGRSLVCNIGFDGTGEHCGKTDAYFSDIFNEPILLDKVPITEHVQAKFLREEFEKNIHIPIISRIINKVRKLFR
jgi:hypothetical protein